MFVPMPYFAILIRVYRAHDLGKPQQQGRPMTAWLRLTPGGYASSPPDVGVACRSWRKVSGRLGPGVVVVVAVVVGVVVGRLRLQRAGPAVLNRLIHEVFGGHRCL